MRDEISRGNDEPMTVEQNLVALQKNHPDLARTRPENGVGIQGASLSVTLTATSNEYLSLPVDGVLKLNELDLNGFIGVATFRERKSDGTLSAPVEVEDIEFEYRP